MIKVKSLFLTFLFLSLFFVYGSLSTVSAENTNRKKQKMIEDSISKYHGKCACPYQLMSNGRKCGKRSAYSKPGGYEPLCYPKDISDDLINSVKRKEFTQSKNIINSSKVRIIDGDTIMLDAKKIRLHGIDTPEIRQKCRDSNLKNYHCGIRAKEELEKLIGNNNVTCETKDKDRYGRLVSICFVNGKDINSILVTNGWALAYRKYSNDYVKEEIEAMKNNLGLWSGRFTFPWEWRRKKK